MMKVERNEYQDLAYKLIEGYTKDLGKVIRLMPYEDYFFFTHAYVKSLLEYEEEEALYEAITDYCKGLSGERCGIFWKVFNYFEPNFSSRWYRSSPDNLELVIFACFFVEKWTNIKVNEGCYGLWQNKEERLVFPHFPFEWSKMVMGSLKDKLLSGQFDHLGISEKLLDYYKRVLGE
jgi:hypothetical protein